MRADESAARVHLARVRQRLSEPDGRADLVQILKVVLAAMIAWVVASRVLDLTQAFLAPWSAMLTVHATVHRTMARGAQSVSATFVGVVVAFVVAQTLGGGVMPLAVALLAGMVISRVGVLRDEGVTVATTALFVLTAEMGSQQGPPLGLLGERLLDVALGVGIGIVVNLLAWPPPNDRVADRQVHQVQRAMGDLMSEMAAQTGSVSATEDSPGWIDRTRDLDDKLARTWPSVSLAEESHWWNPRGWFSRGAPGPTDQQASLSCLEDGLAHLRAIARAVDESTRSAQEWDGRFRETWLDLLTECGRRVTAGDLITPDLRSRLVDLSRDLSTEDLPALFWPHYGLLLTSLAGVLDAVEGMRVDGEDQDGPEDSLGRAAVSD